MNKTVTKIIVVAFLIFTVLILVEKSSIARERNLPIEEISARNNQGLDEFKAKINASMQPTSQEQLWEQAYRNFDGSVPTDEAPVIKYYTLYAENVYMWPRLLCVDPDTEMTDRALYEAKKLNVYVYDNEGKITETNTEKNIYFYPGADAEGGVKSADVYAYILAKTSNIENRWHLWCTMEENVFMGLYPVQGGFWAALSYNEWEAYYNLLLDPANKKIYDASIKASKDAQDAVNISIANLPAGVKVGKSAINAYYEQAYNEILTQLGVRKEEVDQLLAKMNEVMPNTARFLLQSNVGALNDAGISGYNLYIAALAYAEWREELKNSPHQEKIDLQIESDTYVIGPVTYVSKHFSAPERKYIGKKKEKLTIGNHVIYRMVDDPDGKNSILYEPSIDETWGEISKIEVALENGQTIEITKGMMNSEENKGNIYFRDTLSGEILTENNEYIFPKPGETKQFKLYIKGYAVKGVKIVFNRVLYGAKTIELDSVKYTYIKPGEVVNISVTIYTPIPGKIPTPGQPAVQGTWVDDGSTKINVFNGKTGNQTVTTYSGHYEGGSAGTPAGNMQQGSVGSSYREPDQYIEIGGSQPLVVVEGYGKNEEEIVTTGEVTKEENVDMALRKFITKVNDNPVESREPETDLTPLNSGETTTAKYNHPKDTVTVQVGDRVTYTIRVYNECKETDAYAAEIRDYLQAGLEFIKDDETNKKYGWTESNGVLTTTYLANEKLDKYDGEKLSYKDVEVVCKVTEEATSYDRIVNIAEISKYAYENSTEGRKEISSDIDSQPKNFPNEKKNNGYEGNGVDGNYVKGQQDDDDFEAVKVPPRVDYTEIAGTVWLDVVEGKQNERNGILTNTDQKMPEEVTVILKKKIGNEFVEINRTKTQGTYSFTIDKDGNELEANAEYKVEFIYGGLIYTPVKAYSLNSEEYKGKDKSAGREITEQRNALNDKFHEIVYGEARNSKGEKTVDLTGIYDRNIQERQSIIKREELNKITPIVAETESFSGYATYVKYINLGLMERPQVNLQLAADVAYVEETLTGAEPSKHEKDSEGKEYADYFSTDLIKFEYDEDSIRKVYNQMIEESDYTTRIRKYKEVNYSDRIKDNKEKATIELASEEENTDLNVYIAYNLYVKNTSSEDTNAKEITVYYPKEYEIVENEENKIWNKTDREIDGQNVKGENVKYKVATTNALAEKTIKSNSIEVIKIYFKVAKENGTLMLQHNANDDISLQRNVLAEITAYTTTEGLIDINSEPGNFDISTLQQIINTNEDDSAIATSLEIKVGHMDRRISGFVWEDIAPEGSEANGKKDAGEKNANGVVVQLIEQVTGADGKKLEYIWQEIVTGSGEVKVSYMDRAGNLHENEKTAELREGENYAFTNYPAGSYIVRFRYGEEIVDKIVQYSGQDYKATTYTAGFEANTSNAKDNKDRRLATMKYSVDQDNATAEILANEGANATELATNTWMYADTVEPINAERGKNDSRTVNFGLVERPKSKLVAIKEIEGVKISNKGIVYVDTAASKTNAQIADPSNINLELDDEILNGATLEVTYRIKVRNEGEADTLYNYFEGETVEGLSEYMEKIGVSNQKDIIKTGATLVYDYPDKMGLDSKTTGWTKDNVETNILKQNVKKYIADNNQLVVKGTDGNLYEKLEPGSESEKWSLVTFSKILSVGGNDNFTYDNKIEIVARSNGVGRRDSESRPGNYVPSEDPEVEPDTDNAKLTITDPKGQARIYFVLGFVSLAMVIAGVILIKKKVLTK